MSLCDTCPNNGNKRYVYVEKTTVIEKADTDKIKALHKPVNHISQCMLGVNVSLNLKKIIYEICPEKKITVLDVGTITAVDKQLYSREQAEVKKSSEILEWEDKVEAIK